MSGNALLLLVEAEDRQEAIDEADGTIDGWWEDNDLHEGDRGYVDAKEHPGETEDGVVCLKDAGKAKLLELNAERTRDAKYYTGKAIAEAARLGFSSLLDVPANHKNSMVGFYMAKAGDIIDGRWCPWGVVYDTKEYESGFSEERVAELMKTPEKYWLVACTVGP